MNKLKVYHIILLAVFIAHTNSCRDEHTPKITEAQIDNLISNGKLNDLFYGKDTLIMAFNMSDCFYPRFDIIQFFRIKKDIFIQAQINTHIDSSKAINCKPQKINLYTNDSISFERLLIKLHQTQIKEDTSNHKSIFLSVGVKQKWKRNYPFNRISSNGPDFINMYLQVMHELYPDIKEFEPFLYKAEDDQITF